MLSSKLSVIFLISMFSTCQCNILFTLFSDFMDLLDIFHKRKVLVYYTLQATQEVLIYNIHDNTLLVILYANKIRCRA